MRCDSVLPPAGEDVAQRQMREKVTKAATLEWWRLMNLLPHHPQCAHWGSFPRWGKHKRGARRTALIAPGLLLRDRSYFPGFFSFSSGKSSKLVKR